MKRVFSSIGQLGEYFKYSQTYQYVFIGDGKNEWSAWKIYKTAKADDIVIFGSTSVRLIKLCFFCWLFSFRKFKFVSIDLLLRKPITPKQKIVTFVESLLLKQVDVFALYFKDTSGYEKYFGIQKRKICYVPFKGNSWEQEFENYIADPTKGDYVLCAGHTMRDLKTYIEAIRIAGVPAVLLADQNAEIMRYHGTNLITEGFPQNLRLEIHNDDKEETYLQWIKNAGVVVIPRFQSDMTASGISAYLCAMAAWRCVVISTGPGVGELLTDNQAILVEPENVDQLSKAILTAWNDKELRTRIAINGRKYVEQLKGEKRFHDDIFELIKRVDTSI